MNHKVSALITLVMSTLLLAACDKPEEVKVEVIRSLPIMTVGDVADIKGRNFPGRAKATQEVDLAFRVSGPLISFPAKVGDKVEEGTLLARIDPREFEVQKRNSEGQLERAKATHTRAASEYKRIVEMREKDKDLVSEVHFDRVKAELELAKADMISVQAMLESAEDDIRYSYLEAPFDGTVVATYVENYEYIQERQTVLRLLDNQRIEFVFSVPETLISHAPYVSNLRVRFDAFPDVEIDAEFKEIGSEASAATRTYPITLIMEQPEGVEILPGMAGKVFGEVSLPTDENQQEIVIPVAAVFSPETEDTSFVWVVDPDANTVSRRVVTPGNLVSTGIVITEGLTKGDKIATAGVHFLQEGQQIKPEVR